MNKKYIFIFSLLVSLFLQAYYPNRFLGQQTIYPVTEYENSIINKFGTYHHETEYIFESQRLNALDENNKLLRMKKYEGHYWNNFALEFVIRNDYEYSNGKLIFVNKMDEEGNFIETFREYTYFNQYLDTVITSDSLVFRYHPQSVYITYNDYQGELSNNRLITFINGQNELTTGWVGRNYDFNSDYMAIGSFAYDEQQRIIWFRYETPADKEHVISENNLSWDNDKLISLYDEYCYHQLEYDEDSRILEIHIYENNTGNIIFSYYYNYDEYGRMILETKECFHYDGSLYSIEIYEYEYCDFYNEVNSEVINSKSSLFKNYPNPFNPVTTISFSLDEEKNVNITVYNLKGQRIKTLLEDKRQSGTYHIQWDGTDDKQHPVSSGIYLYQLKTNSNKMTKRMLLLK